MIKSMTGYGRAQKAFESRDITVEIKSVNHRFFEFSARTPRAYGYLDEKLKALLQGEISRGKVEVSVQLLNAESQGTQVEVNRELAASYAEALRSLGEELSLTDDLSLSVFARLPDLFCVSRAQEDAELVIQQVTQVASEALEQFLNMRRAEGEKLKADVLSRLDTIEADVGQVEQLSPQTVQAYRDKLTAKIQEVLADSQADEQRIVTEAAIFAEKIAVDEETVRLRSHLHQFREILQSEEPVGRKLDFLVQECNRETNTIGSKAMDLKVTRLVVEMKSEIEKIREQIQNIE